MASSLSHPKYRPDIDGLRAVAVLGVVAYHAFPHWLKGGFIGVDIFFVISGYLISTILFQNLEQGRFSFREFYARRVKRIFPALLLVLASCCAFGWFALLTDEYRQLGKHVMASAGFVQNIVLWTESGYFDNDAQTKPLLHIWSLGVEEQFYFIWPLCLWACWKRKWNALAAILGIAAFSFALNLFYLRHDPVAAFFLPQTRFWELLSGSLLAYLHLYRPDDSRRLNGNLVAAFGTVLLVAGFACVTDKKLFPGFWALLPVIGAVCVIGAGPQAWINRVLLSNRLAVWIGLISYPLYLWHWPLLFFGRLAHLQEAGSTIFGYAVITLAVLDGLNPDPDPDYIAALRRRIAFLESKNVQVIIFTPHLTLGFDPKQCYAIPMRSTARDCSLPAEARQTAYDKFKPLIDDITRTHPRVKFFEQNDIYCPSGDRCSYLSNGMPLGRDEWHISEYASVQLQNYFTPWARDNLPELLDAIPANELIKTPAANSP